MPLFIICVTGDDFLDRKVALMIMRPPRGPSAMYEGAIYSHRSPPLTRRRLSI